MGPLQRTLKPWFIDRPSPIRARAMRGAAPVTLHNTALGDRDGEARLLLPPDLASNDGVARIVTDADPSDRTVTVRVRRLDDVFEGAGADVLKLDVEGHEPQALAGASATLQARRLTHIVFEDHDVARSEAVRLLRDAGYQLFALGWSMRLLRRCHSPGWRVLRPWLRRPHGAVVGA